MDTSQDSWGRRAAGGQAGHCVHFITDLPKTARKDRHSKQKENRENRNQDMRLEEGTMKEKNEKTKQTRSAKEEKICRVNLQHWSLTT